MSPASYRAAPPRVGDPRVHAAPSGRRGRLGGPPVTAPSHAVPGPRAPARSGVRAATYSPARGGGRGDERVRRRPAAGRDLPPRHLVLRRTARLAARRATAGAARGCAASSTGCATRPGWTCRNCGCPAPPRRPATAHRQPSRRTPGRPFHRAPLSPSTTRRSRTSCSPGGAAVRGRRGSHCPRRAIPAPRGRPAANGSARSDRRRRTTETALTPCCEGPFRW